MLKIKMISVFFVLSLLSYDTMQGQDLHFSQFFNSPLSVNPANTGFMPDADYRIGVNYRNQWSSILSNPYKTMSVFGDAQILNDRFENGWVGIGGLVLSDQAGSGSMRSTKIYGSAAYHQMLGEASLLSAGFNLGWANKRIDISRLKFPSQFNGKFFDTNIPSDITLNSTNISYFDMQVGMNYAYFPDDNTYINAGYSIHHVNRPVESFFSTMADSSRIAMRHIGFVNAILKLNDRVIINPNIYYTYQAKSSEIVGGLNANYNLGDSDGEKQLIAGVYFRVGDAVVPMVGFVLKNIKFTFSYDATVSPLKNFNNLQGASEFSLIKNGFYGSSQGDTRKVLCPKF